MSQRPDEPEIPTLTFVVRPGTTAPTQPETPATAADSPTIPDPGPTPEDLGIEQAVDGPGTLDGQDMLHASAPPSLVPLETLIPPAPLREDASVLRVRVERLVDEALAMRIPELREQLMKTVLQALSDGQPGPGGEPAGD